MPPNDRAATAANTAIRKLAEAFELEGLANVEAHRLAASTVNDARSNVRSGVAAILDR